MIARCNKSLAENWKEVYDRIATADLIKSVLHGNHFSLEQLQAYLLHELTAGTKKHSAEMLSLAICE